MVAIRSQSWQTWFKNKKVDKHHPQPWGAEAEVSQSQQALSAWPSKLAPEPAVAAMSEPAVAAMPETEAEPDRERLLR